MVEHRIFYVAKMDGESFPVYNGTATSTLIRASGHRVLVLDPLREPPYRAQLMVELRVGGPLLPIQQAPDGAPTFTDPEELGRLAEEERSRLAAAKELVLYYLEGTQLIANGRAYVEKNGDGSLKPDIIKYILDTNYIPIQDHLVFFGDFFLPVRCTDKKDGFYIPVEEPSPFPFLGG